MGNRRVRRWLWVMEFQSGGQDHKFENLDSKNTLGFLWTTRCWKCIWSFKKDSLVTYYHGEWGHEIACLTLLPHSQLLNEWIGKSLFRSVWRVNLFSLWRAVNSHVRRKFLFNSEARATLLAGKSLFSGVNDHVRCEVRFYSEALSTLLAAEGFFSSVNSHVELKAH